MNMMDTEKENREIYEQFYKGSNIINITSYFDKYKSLIKKSSCYKHYKHELGSFVMNAIDSEIDDEKYDLLSNYCSVDNLTVDGELKKMTKLTYEWCKDSVDPSIINNVQLQTVIDTKLRNSLQNYQVCSKYRSEKPIVHEAVTLKENDLLLTPESDILVCVRVYVPFTCRHKQNIGALSKMSVNYVIALHGSQTLDKLRDLITCISDDLISTEMSDTPVRHKVENAKNVYKSGFFFFENTFYNDYRDPSNKDNSKFIREWAEAKGFGTYKTEKMEETRIDSLVLKFGFPWVYQHQGDCQHLISFSDARFVSPSDELNADGYPRIMRIKPRPNRYCMTCGTYGVTWITTSNDRLPHNPCLFCNTCFKSYNYIKGKKIGSFAAYPYPYNSDLLNICVGKRIKLKSNTLSHREKESETHSEASHSGKYIKAEQLKMDTS